MKCWRAFLATNDTNFHEYMTQISSIRLIRGRFPSRSATNTQQGDHRHVEERVFPRGADRTGASRGLFWGAEWFEKIEQVW